MTTRRKLADTQLQLLLDAWNLKVYQRINHGQPYSWNTRVDGNVTQQTNRLYPQYLTLVELPNSFGLNSKRFLPNHAGEQLLIDAGRIEQPS